MNTGPGNEAVIINLIGGANTGKTTTALGLAHYMKLAGLRVAYAPEYATEMVYEERGNILLDQLYILAKQNRRLHRLRQQVDYVITDSSLLLGLVYAEDGGTPEFRQLVHSHFDSYRNQVFYFQRDPTFKFEGQGRIQQSHDECVDFDKKVQEVLPGGTFWLARGQDYIQQIGAFFGLELGPKALKYPPRVLGHVREPREGF